MNFRFFFERKKITREKDKKRRPKTSPLCRVFFAETAAADADATAAPSFPFCPPPVPRFPPPSSQIKKITKTNKKNRPAPPRVCSSSSSPALPTSPCPPPTPTSSTASPQPTPRRTLLLDRGNHLTPCRCDHCSCPPSPSTSPRSTFRAGPAAARWGSSTTPGSTRGSRSRRPRRGR